MNTKPPSTGSLYIIATPIGHPSDITLRALELLKMVDAIICEDRRQGSTTLKKVGINPGTLIELNEHNEQEVTPEILNRLMQGENLALISDCGTPVFADPGHHLIRQVCEMDIPIVPVPGPSSLTAALSVLNFEIRQFVFGGFLPRQPEARRNELRKLRAFRMPVILMDTPYRLETILGEVEAVFGNHQEITLVCEISLPTEAIYRGQIHFVKSQLKKPKAEFVLIIHY
ncbi:MAG: 16S rRNA (cytidine(1402)-2'-O)-methyltransferase [Anaerolineaceae bacterium]|nr:16S rRNA (cytidine(1402)-2'-O)-methyltransferase [Anaerolineaceae bacterium]